MTALIPRGLPSLFIDELHKTCGCGNQRDWTATLIDLHFDTLRSEKIIAMLHAWGCTIVQRSTGIKMWSTHHQGGHHILHWFHNHYVMWKESILYPHWDLVCGESNKINTCKVPVKNSFTSDNLPVRHPPAGWLYQVSVEYAVLVGGSPQWSQHHSSCLSLSWLSHVHQTALHVFPCCDCSSGMPSTPMTSNAQQTRLNGIDSRGRFGDSTLRWERLWLVHLSVLFPANYSHTLLCTAMISMLQELRVTSLRVKKKRERTTLPHGYRAFQQVAVAFVVDQQRWWRQHALPLSCTATYFWSGTRPLSCSTDLGRFRKMATGRAHGQLFAAAARIPRAPIWFAYFGPPTVRIFSYFLPVRRGGCEALTETSFWE